VQVRNCAWTGNTDAVEKRAVWARESVVSYKCPKSIITAKSIEYLEQFQLWKQFGGGTPWMTEAKTADAILLVEQQWQMEANRG